MSVVSYDFDGVVISFYRSYFDSELEAREWMEFDEGGNEEETMANWYPDRYAEWQRWRDAWEAAGGDTT